MLYGAQLLDIPLARAANAPAADSDFLPESRVEMFVDAGGTWHGVALWMSLSLVPAATEPLEGAAGGGEGGGVEGSAAPPPVPASFQAANDEEDLEVGSACENDERMVAGGRAGGWA